MVQFSVDRKVFLIFCMVLLAIAGVRSYTRLGKLEDPEFTIKTALVFTSYPGATPDEVEEQVTEVIEKAAQQLESLEHVRSVSQFGLSIVYVDVKESYRAEKMSQIWDELRRRIVSVQSQLPPGAMPPQVNDNFGDVYGIFLALTGDGFSYAELKKYATFLQKNLLLVNHVAKVEIWGTQKECVLVESPRARLSEMGIHPQQVTSALKQQNAVVNAGSLDINSERIRLTPTGAFHGVEEIGDLVLQASPKEQLILLKDVAKISRRYLDPPTAMMRFNGKPALGIAISTVSGGNVVEMGEAVKKKLNVLMTSLPVGVEVGVVSYQADTVQESVNGFVENLAESVIIVICVLLVTMGMRSGLLIGAILMLTIMATLVIMMGMGIDLQRTSLGAMIIAMGMLVDNAIVVTEGTLIKLQRGEKKRSAVIDPPVQTAWPLLGATLVAIFAFLPIYLSKNNTGEYCLSLFQVVAISLLFSWVLAMTANPVLCDLFLRVEKTQQEQDPYDGVSYKVYRSLLVYALHRRFSTLLMMAGLLFLSIYGFKYVDKIFFPEATRNQFMVDYWLPEGSRIQNVSEDLKKVEKYLMGLPEVTSVASCIGSGPPRFYLPYEPEVGNSSYGQLIVNVTHMKKIDKLLPGIERYLLENFPQAEPRVRKFPLGPAVNFKIEARFSGPEIQTLRCLSKEAREIMSNEAQCKNVRDDWRQLVKTWSPVFSQNRARRSLVTRMEMATAIQRLTDGIMVGTYREGDELLPILVRAPQEERHDIENLELAPIWGYHATSFPLRQIISGRKIEWKDARVRRRDRSRTITVQSDVKLGSSANDVLAELRPKIKAMKLPPGYSLEWGGEFEKSYKSRSEVVAQLPLALVLMALVVVSLFRTFRESLIIFLTLPLSIIGVTMGLLLTREPFGFMALLGALSLLGMMIKNAVILLDQINLEIQEGKKPYDAVVESCVGRLRPVSMAALTTVLGMLPLVWDTLFSSMAVTIIFGLSFATVLTLFVVPVLYVIGFNVQERLVGK